MVEDTLRYIDTGFGSQQPCLPQAGVVAGIFTYYHNYYTKKNRPTLVY